MKKIVANIFFIANVCIVCAIAFHVDMLSLTGIGTVFMCIVTLAGAGLVAKESLFKQEKEIDSAIFFLNTFCLIMTMFGFILIFIVNA